MTCILITLVLATSAGAATLGDYRDRLAKAAELVDAAVAGTGYSEGLSREVKALVPASEPIETGGRRLMVNNAWLHDLLDSTGEAQDPNLSLAKLKEAAGRLKSLMDYVAALEAGDADDTAGIRRHLGEILARPEYQVRQDDRVTAFIKRVKHRVRDLFLELLDLVFGRAFGAGREASWVFRGIVILGLAAMIFVITRMIVRSRKGQKRRGSRIVLGEEIDANVTAGDVANSALQAAQKGDFRAAIRGLYLALLLELADRRLLELEANATNRDYMNRIARYDALESPMSYLTERFEYFWYGMFPSTEGDFEVYLERYRQAIGRAGQIGSGELSTTPVQATEREGGAG